MSDPQINEWTSDFHQAKIALRNLEVLVRTLTQSQMNVFTKLKLLYEKYDYFVNEDGSKTQKEAIAEQITLFGRIEHNIHMTTSKFSGKAAAQLDAARTQVNFIYHSLGKLRSLKEPQFTETQTQMKEQIPEFLNLFDAFLARFTLEVRLQQADFFKQLGGAFTHAGQPEPVNSITKAWLSSFEQIMPAVEALKTVNPQPDHAKAPHTSAAASADENNGNFNTEKVDSVLLAPVKWIHSKVTRDLKDFRFSDPRRGFFNKPTHPPKHAEEVVRAVFDFKGETESDLKFHKGDLIRLIDRGTEDDPNWWCGELDGQRGLFPRNYVEDSPHKHHSRYTDHHGQGEKKDLHPDEYVPKLSPSQEEATKKNPTDLNEEHPPVKPPRPHKEEAETADQADQSQPESEPEPELSAKVEAADVEITEASGVDGPLAASTSDETQVKEPTKAPEPEGKLADLSIDQRKSDAVKATAKSEPLQGVSSPTEPENKKAAADLPASEPVSEEQPDSAKLSSSINATSSNETPQSEIPEGSLSAEKDNSNSAALSKEDKRGDDPSDELL